MGEFTAGHRLFGPEAVGDISRDVFHLAPIISET